jgi:cytochrome c oxidase subunit 4
MNDEARAQPGTGTYLVVAALLTVLTAMEVTVFYVHAMRPVLKPVLMVLSAAKFALIVLFYMHLRYDRWAFSTIFGFQLAMACVVVVSLTLLFATFYLSP